MTCKSESEKDDDAQEYVFREVGDGVYVRKCYGLEELASNMEEHCDGFTHLTGTAAVSILSVPTRQDTKAIEAHIQNAWATFRQYTPSIACKTFRLPDGERRFAFRYTVPRSEEDVRAWVDETVFFADDNGRTVFEKHCELKDGKWWKCSDDRYVAELHVARGAASDDWVFSMVFSHNSIDGRNVFAMLDLFFGFLRRQLEGNATPVSSLEWGPEVVRLPPPGAFTMALAESGSLPDIALPKPAVEPPQQILEEVVKEENPPALVPWLYAPHSTGSVGDVSRIVTFSEETTMRLHAACKRRGYTITQAVTALSVLAHSESALLAAGGLSAERFAEVSGTFGAATHYLIAWNFINHRHKLPGGYDSYESPKSTALCTADGVPLFVSMDGIRGCIELEEGKMTEKRVVNEDAFWDVLVRGIADAWKATDTSLEGYTTRELTNHHGFKSFNPHMFDVPALIVSSVGDLERLNILQGGGSSLVVKDVICGIRVRTPPVMNLLWQYRRRISCHFMSAGEYTTSAELERITRLYEEWTAALIV